MKKMAALVIIVLLCMSTFSILAPKVNAQETVIFQDDFESYALGSFPSSGGWEIVWNGAGDEQQIITNARSYTGAKSFSLLGASGWSCVVQKKFSSNAPIIGYELSILIEDRTSGVEHPGFHKLGGEGQYWGAYYAVTAFHHENGKIMGEDGTVLGDWEPQTWYRVRTVLDRTSKTYSVWINGVLKGQDMPLYRSQPEIIDSFALVANWGCVRVYYDDVKVFEAGETPPPQGGLVGYWSFDEGSGAIAHDSSGNSNHGVLNNGPVWVDGRFGKALSFDGVDDYVRIEPSSSLDVTSQITVEAWVYPRAYVDSNGDNSHIISRCAINGGAIYVLQTYSPTSTKAGYAVNQIPWHHASSADLPLNTWTHLAMTYDGATVKLYINGELDSSYVQSGPIEVTSNWLSFGCKPTGPWGGAGTYAYFNGIIDEVRIYNRALSQQEIQTDMGEISPPIEHPIKLSVIQKPVVSPEGPEFQVRLESRVNKLIMVKTRVDVSSYQALIYTEEKISFVEGFSTMDLTFSAPVCTVNNILLTVNFMAECVYEGHGFEERQKVIAIASNEIDMPNSVGGFVVVVDDPADDTLTLDPSRWDPKWQTSVFTSNGFKTAFFGFKSDFSAHKYLELRPEPLNTMPQQVREDLNAYYQGAGLTLDYVDFVLLLKEGSLISPKHIPIPLQAWEKISPLWGALNLAKDFKEVFDEILKNPFPATSTEQHQRIMSVASFGFSATCIVGVGVLATPVPPAAILLGAGCVGYSTLKFLQSTSGGSGTSSCMLKPLLSETISTSIEPGYTCPSAKMQLVPLSDQSSVSIFEKAPSPLAGQTVMVPLVRQKSGDRLGGLVFAISYDQTGWINSIPTATSTIEIYPMDPMMERLIYEAQYPAENRVVLRAINPSEMTSVYVQEYDHDLLLTVRADGDYVGLDPNGNVHIGISGAWFSGFTWPIKEILLPNWLSTFDIIVDASLAVLPVERFDLTVSFTNSTGQISATTTLANCSINRGESKCYTVSLFDSNLQMISWEYVFKDAKRGTILKISIEDKHFQFIAPNKDFGVKYDPRMIILRHVIIICFEDKEMRLIATAVDDKIDFCSAIASDKQTRKTYILIDKPNC